ncbi:MAG TPA: hypothetical protein DER64_23620 [Planctomycetaceae bacterium]|nr:hypothetical protein [Planctomycetaceae bacterium]|tara:strand:- start:536 stop:1882 length:1347 start_codon:yes stop_codon:yes gene_type:complete
MTSPSRELTRRDLLVRSAAWTLAPALFAGTATAGNRKRPRVAAIFTEFRFRSHAYNILENFFRPYLFRGRLVDPGVDIVSFYADQFPNGDMARDVAKKYNVPLFDSIEKAMCVGGTSLAVDAVLSIGEHGDYPVNDLGQKMYPRKRFFDAAVAVMKRAGRYVPLFNDKHYSYRWDWAREMVDVARANRMPLLAGSSVPLAQRRPCLELPRGTKITEAISVHGGPLESYGFHGLEVLQSMVETRGEIGETGIARIQVLEGEALFDAARQGRWSLDLAEAAMLAELDRRPRSMTRLLSGHENSKPHAILVEYRDGLKAAVLKVGNDSNRWNFACRVAGESKPRATALFNGPWGNRCLFKGLSHSIQSMFIHGQEPYPAERTLLVTGALDTAVRSYHAGGKALDTPHLDVTYTPTDVSDFRENGRSWQVITKHTPQPRGFEPGDHKFLDQD